MRLTNIISLLITGYAGIDDIINFGLRFSKIFHWKINDNSCIVTQIQEELAGSKDTSFTHNLFKKIGIEIPDGFDVAYFINSLAILLSTMRLLN